MAEFFQSPDQQDQDALKKALLAKLFGGPIPGAVPPPGATQRSLTGTPDPGTPPTAPPATTQPNASSTPTATPVSAASGPQPAKPLASAAPIQPGEAQPFPTKPVYDQQNPLPTHTPYIAPDFKHRLLEGIFAGMQEFGRPGEGAKTVRDYLGNIEKKQEEEKNYPNTAAALQQQRYIAAGQAAEVPEHLKQLHATIQESEARARDLNAKAIAAGQPKPEKNLQQMHAEAMQDALARGVDPATDPKVKQVEDAIQRIQKEPAGAKQSNKEQIQSQMVAEMAKPQPDHKLIQTLQQRLRDIDPLAEDRIRDAESRAADAQKKGSEKTDLATREKVLTYFKPAQDADVRLGLMEQNLQSALKGDQQAQVNLLANHVALTMGMPRGKVPRVSHEMFLEAQQSSPILQRIEAHFSKEGYLSGVVLTPQQMNYMVNLAKETREKEWESAHSSADYIGIDKADRPKSIYKGAGQKDAGAFDSSKLTNFHTNGQQRIGFDGKQWVDAVTGKPVQ